MKDFSDYVYFPAIRSRPAEIDGYKNLGENTKDNVVPLVTLGAWPSQTSIGHSLNEVEKAFGHRSFFLDLTTEQAHQTQDLKALLIPENGFEAWRKFSSLVANAIPVLQFGHNARLPSLIKQARQFYSGGKTKLAVRIKDFQTDTSKAVSVLSALDEPEKCMVFIDLGYIRDTMSASIAAAISAINEIRADIPEANICVLSTSFPSSVTTFSRGAPIGQSGAIDILERRIFDQIGRDAATYGDHSSIHGRVYPSTGGTYTPRIDYPQIDTWVFERRMKTDSKGYIDAAKAQLLNNPQITEEVTWGARKIVDASQGKLDGMKTPSRWIAARVNMHITRQLEYQNSLNYSAVDDEGFGDDL